MKYFILFLALASLAFGQSATLSVNPSTGAIRGPITAETFKTANSIQPLDADLTTFAGITPSANVQSILSAADYAAIRTALSLTVGTNVQAYDADLTTWAGVTPSANGQSLVAAANYAAMRGLLDLEAGTDFLAYPTGTPTGSKYLRDDNTWQAITGGDVTLTGTNVYTAGSSTFNSGTTVAVNGTFGGTPTGGTLDLSAVTLSLGNTTVSTLNVTAFGTGVLPAANGGAGTINGILKANGSGTVSAATSGTDYVAPGGNIGAATATTPAENDNDTSVATTAYVQTEIASISGLSGGMGALWPTADIASPPSGYFEAGLYGTTAQTALGSWSIVVKSLGTLATPTVSPAAGEIADGSTITFSSTDSGVTFRHTTSGTDPTYTTGTTGATATLSGATTYEFIATKAGYPPSGVQSVSYTVPVGITYDTQQDFEGTGATGTGWAGSGNWDYTSAPLVGSQSGHLDGAYEDFTYTYSEDKSTIYGKFLIRQTATPGAGLFYFMRILSSADAVVGRILLTSSNTLRIEHGTAADETSATFSLSTTYYVWFEYTAGTSGTFKLWFNTTDSKPTGDATKQAEIVASTSGMSSTSPRKVQGRIDNSAYFLFDSFELAQVAIP